VILAGGESRRFGRNKALVGVRGVPLIERVTGVMQSLFRQVILVTNTPEEYAHLQLPMHEDLIKGLGPLGGIYTGLTVMENGAGFFVGCDMPFLNRHLIHHMVRIRESFDAVVPRVSDKLEALHALYTKGCLRAIGHLIDSREYQILKFLKDVSVRYVDEDEIRACDPQMRSFFNINRPEEIKKLEA
jgi:molybdopterin-guanine dinucleotide biosynthesis protein A